MSFIPQLSFVDHQRLRRIVLGVHMKNYPDDLMTNVEADRIIESIAPDVLEHWLRVKVDSREIA